MSNCNGESMTLSEVAKRCDVCLATVSKWVGGIRVGSDTVKLECEVVGTRCRVTESQLAKFKSECHRAKFGDGPPPRQESQKQRAARSRRALAAAGLD
jgi:transposase